MVIKSTAQPQEEPKENRHRSTQLDPALVRMHARAKGIYHRHAFESQYHLFHNNLNKINTPANAWNGKKLEFEQAQNVALFLGLKHYAELELNQSTSQWSGLLNNPNHREKLFDWQFADQDQWRTVDFSLLYPAKDEDLEQISVDEQWQLLLYGEPGHAFAVFLQSDQLVCQIAPIDLESCRSVIAAQTQAIEFPPQPQLKFNKDDGLGRRRLIVIRSKHIPLAPRSEDTGHLLSALELEHFASRLLQDKTHDIAADVYEFMLVA